MSIKVIVMDIDGTLYNSNKQISLKTKEALLLVQRNGIKLILASGRPTSGLIDIVKELEMEQYHGLLVSFNGSMVVDVKTKEVLFNETLSIDEGKSVLEHMKQFDVIPMIQKDDYMYVNNVYNCMIQVNNKDFNIIEYESRSNKYKLSEINDLSSFVDFPLNKILVAGEIDYLNKNYLDMMEPFKDKMNCMFTAPFYFEYTAKDIDKVKALKTVLEPMGYHKDEIMAFGDGQNDCSMIEYAGIGIAMNNAHDELKKIADDITLSNDEDGIAFALSKYKII